MDYRRLTRQSDSFGSQRGGMARDKGKYDCRKISDMRGRATRNGKPGNPQNLEGNVGQLLPGILDDIVLDHIVPKLPWKAFHILSSVSPNWQLAIQSGQIYNARVRSNSVETLVAFDHFQPDGSGIHAMSLFSVRDDSWHQLPKFPFYRKGIPEICSCVAADGKFYIFPHCTTGYGVEDMASDDNGVEDSASRNGHIHSSGDSDGIALVPKTGREVFVFDLVGQRGWKRCADMPEARCAFACCALHGKVYVLGGKLTGSILLGDNGVNGFRSIPPTRECLMYDPEEDRWSSVAPMIINRFRHEVMVLGDRLWVNGGHNGQENKLAPEVYHPMENKWHRSKLALYGGEMCLFAAKGRAFLMSSEPPLEMLYEAYSIEEEPLSNGYPKWKEEHQVWIDEDVGKDFSKLGSIAVAGAEAVDDELLVLLETYDAKYDRGEAVLCRNRTFGRVLENGECLDLVVEPTTFSQHGRWARWMCPIKL